MLLEVGQEHDHSGKACRTFVDRILSFVDVSALRLLKVVVNSVNGA